MTKIISCFLIFYFFLPAFVQAAPVYDHDLGTWTDEYTDNTGTSSRSGVNVDTSDGKLKLTNAGGTFTAPYNTSGYAITTTIGSTLGFLVAEWGEISFDAEVPENTSFIIQILDEANKIYPDSLLPGNSSGFSTSPIDISSLSVDRAAVANVMTKVPRIRLKITFSTTNTNETSSLNSLSFNWTRTKGDLSLSPPAETSWPVSNTNEIRNPRSSYYDISPTYYTFRWLTEIEKITVGNFGLDRNNQIYLKAGEGFDQNSGNYTPGTLAVFDPLTGLTSWQRESDIGYYFAISQNDSLYSYDINDDALVAYNLNEGGRVKWIYQFNSGHNSNVILGNDGTLYFARINGTALVYAFNPDGTIKWSTDVSVPGIDTSRVSNLIIDSDETLYAVSYRANDLNSAVIVALNTADGSILRQTPAIASNFIILDNEDTAYIASTTYSTTPSEKKIMAIKKDGSTKWEKSIGVTTDYFTGIGLKDNSTLLTSVASLNSTSSLKSYNTANGEELFSLSPLSTQLGLRGSGAFYIGNLYYFTTATMFEDPYFYAYDFSGNKKWRIKYDGDSNAAEFFEGFLQDSNGNIYTSLINYYTTYGMRLFSLSSWELSSSPNTSDDLQADQDVTLTANTSMLTTNPLSNDPNYLQAVMANGDKVSLTYDSTNADGDTVWIGNYTLPADTPDGEYEYTLEANAAGIETDIPTHFASPAVDSENTGITTTGSFTVDSTPPTDTAAGYAFNLSYPSGYSKDSNKPTLVFSKASDATSGVASYAVSLDDGKNLAWSLTGIPATHDTTKSSSVWRNDSQVKVEFIDEQDSDPANDEIRVYFKGLDDSPMTQGMHTWKVTATDNAGNAFTKTQDFYLDTTAPSLAEAAVAGVGLLTLNASLVSPQVFTLDPTNPDQRTPSFSGTAIDTYTGSTKTNSNGTTDTFAKVASGPSKATLTLMKLKGSVSSTFNLQPSNLKLADFSDYLTHDYPLSGINDLPDNRKEAAFYLTSPQPVEDGFYRVTLTATDQAGNTHTTAPFYLNMNYRDGSASSDSAGLLTRVTYALSGNQLDLEITHEEPVTDDDAGQLTTNNTVSSALPTLRVTVVDRRQQPIPNARVELHSEPMVAYTDDQGVAVFNEVERGEHTLKIAYADYRGEEKLTLDGDEIREFKVTVEVNKNYSLWLWGAGGAALATLVASLLHLKKRS